MTDSLSDQDRDYVGALIKAAASEVLTESQSYVRAQLRRHAKECPHILRGKALLFGMLLASSAGGVGLLNLLKTVAQWFGG